MRKQVYQGLTGDGWWWLWSRRWRQQKNIYSYNTKSPHRANTTNLTGTKSVIDWNNYRYSCNIDKPYQSPSKWNTKYIQDTVRILIAIRAQRRKVASSIPDGVIGISYWHNPCGQSGDRIPVGARFSAPVQTGPAAHPASCTIGTGSFQVVKSGRGVTLTPHPLLVPWSWKSRAIPLLLIWALRPVQSLSACTRVHFTFTLLCVC